jgi:DNA polymerase-1
LLVSDASALPTVAAAIDNTALVGLDVETTGLDPRKDQVRLLSLTCDNFDGARNTYLLDCFAVDPSPLWEALAGKELVIHNAAFDLAFLAALGLKPGKVQDTMILSQLVYGTRKPKGFHTLAGCAEREVGRPLDKTLQKADWGRALTPAMLAYAAADADVLLPLLSALGKKVAASGQQAVAEIESRCLPAVVWLAGAGVALDWQDWCFLEKESREEATALKEQLDAQAPLLPGQLFTAVNWRSPQQVLAVFQGLGVQIDGTDDDTLAGVDHPLADLLRQYRSAATRATTWGRNWDRFRHEGRVYAGWRQIGSEAGRMACRDPNLQNLPRGSDYRNCVAASPGMVLVKADYSQIELRIACKIAGDGRMLSAYRQGEDLHRLTAALVLNKLPADVTKADRQLAKAINFGFLYGMGWRTFRGYARKNYGVSLNEGEARSYKRAFFRAYPGLRDWHDRVRQAHALETRTLTGRRRQLRVDESDTYRLNSPVQGTGADGLKLALALLHERRHECPKAFPVLAVHDEVVLEAPADKADEAAAWLKRCMVDAMAPLIDPVPCEVETSVGPTWAG